MDEDNPVDGLRGLKGSCQSNLQSLVDELVLGEAYEHSDSDVYYFHEPDKKEEALDMMEDQEEAKRRNVSDD